MALAQKHLDQIAVKQLMEDILREAKTQGASSAEVGIGLNKGFSVTARERDVESIEYNQDKHIGITVYFGHRTGSASLSDIRPEAIREAVKAACNIAKFTDEDKYSGLADKAELGFHYPELPNHFAWPISVEHAAELAVECEQRALAKDKRIICSEGVTITTADGLHGYGNSNGFLGVYPSTTHEISCVLVAKQKDEMQRDYYYSVSVDPDELTPIGEIADLAVERTVRRLGSQRLSTRQTPVIYVAEEARGLLGHFVSAIQGSHLYRKSSFLLDHLGQMIFPETIDLYEQPHLPKALGSAPFDDNGVATRNNIFIEKGKLKSYSLGVYAARKLGLKTTANAGGVHNLFITTGQKNLAQLLKTMDTGLLITELMGQGVNLVTGDYSRGAAGFWVEKGVIQYPVEEITIAGNLKEMFKQIVEVGNDVDTRGNVRTGSILIENMMIAGH